MVSPKAVVAKLIDWLPAGTCRAVLERAASRTFAYDVFQALARRYGVRDICIAGDYGLIEGSIDDDSVLAGYGRHKTWASQTNRMFTDFFSRNYGGTYLDIGANIGLTTIPVAYNRLVSCLAFEPEPENHRYLEHNIGRNCRHGNVRIYQMALFDQQAVVDFELSKRNRGDHRIRREASKGTFDEQLREVIQVRADRLDAVVDRASLAPPLAAKVDTQGAECQVFAGGQETLSRAELIAFEYWPYGIQRAGGDVAFLTSFLERYFTAGAMLTGDGNDILSWRPIDEVIARMVSLKHSDEVSAYHYHDVFVRK